MPFANVKLKWTGEDNYDQVLDVISKAQSGLPRELLIPTAFGCLSEICLDAREIYLARPTPRRFSSFAGGLPLAGILLPAAFSTVLGMLAWRRYKSSLLTLVQLGVRRSDVLRSMVFGSFKRSIGNMISALLGIPLAALLISNLGAQYAGSEIIGLNIQWNYIGAILLSLILFPLLSGYLIFALAARRETMLKLKDQLSKFFDLRIIALGVIVVSVAQLARLGIGERSAVIYSNLLSVSMALGVIYPLSLLFLSRQKRKGGSSRIWTSLALGSSKQMLVQSFATAVIASFAVATFANILSLRNEDRVYYSDWPEKALIFDYGQLPNLSERQKYFEAINSVVSEPGIEVSLLNSKDVPLKFVSDLSTRGAIYSVKNVSDLERLFGEKLVPEAVTTLQNGGVLIGSNGYRYEEGQSGRAVVGERSGERREVDYFIQDIDPRWANGYGGFVLDEAFEKGDSFFSIPVFSVYPSSKALFDAAAAAVQNANLIPNVIQKEQGFQDLPLSRTLLIGLGSFMLLLITFNWASLKSLRNVLNSYANNFLTIGVPRALIWRSVFKVNAITAFFTLSAVATSALFIYVQVSLTYRPGIAEFPWVVLLALFVLLSTWTYVNSAMMAKKLEPTIAYSRGL
jgi:hypothetical protein